jgi:hypothetical protein
MTAHATIDKVSSKAGDLGTRAHELASDVLPPLQDIVLPKVTTAASAVADVAKDKGGDLWVKVSESEQGHELARRAALVAAGAKGESPKRWPLLLAGIVTGLAVGTLVGRRTAVAAKPSTEDSTSTR